MTGYMISNGNGMFIRLDKESNKYVPIRGREYGTIWTDLQKATNICNTLPSAIRRTYSVEGVPISIQDHSEKLVEKKCCPTTPARVPVQAEKEEKTAEVTEKGKEDEVAQCIAAIEKMSSESIRRFDGWQTKIEDVLGFIREVDDRTDQLILERSHIDKKLTDLQHYIEFNNLDAYRGYLAYKKMNGVLQERRKVKDELYVMQAIKKYVPDYTDFAGVLRAISDMDKRQYSPRVLSELFEGGISQ